MKKRFFYYLSLFVILLITVTSCKDDENEPTPPNSAPSITIPSSEFLNPVLSQQGETAFVSFTASADWTASLINSRAESWITVSPPSGSKGENEITITATVNDTPDERNATIVLKCGSDTKNIVVSQKQKDALTVTSSKYEVESKGGDINVEVKSNINFEVEVKVDWIKQQTEKTRALKTNNLAFSIEHNETGEKREGEIVIKSGELSETIKVYQGFEDFIVLTQKVFTLPEEGGDVDIEIKSTLAYEAKMLSDVDWITEIKTRAVSTHTHRYTIIPNDAYDSRETKIVFYNPKDETVADTVSIFQMYKGAILVARNDYQFSVKGGALNLMVQSNLEFDVEVSDEWIKQTQSTRALAENNLNFTITENKEQKDREGTITVKDKNSNKKQVVTVKQSYKDLERDALMALYKATNGDNWTNNTNWCSAKPLSEWYGIETNEYGEVIRIVMQRNKMVGCFPTNIGDLKKLKYLRLNDNYFHGELPESFYDLTELEYFSVGNYNIGAEGGSIIVDPNNPTVPLLGKNQLSGRISEKIGNLKKLREFDINLNNFSGKLPDEIWTLSKLEALLMLHNHNGDDYLCGELPEDIGNLQNLRQLWLQGNKFEGELPNAIKTLSNLEELIISYNYFIGELPESIGDLKKLKQFECAHNLFTGKLPASISELSNIESMDFRGMAKGTISYGDCTHELENNNYFTGELPNLSKLKKLGSFVVSGNGITGELPNNVEELVNLHCFNADRCNLTGNVPKGFAKLTKLYALTLNDNRLSGVLPVEIVEMDLWKKGNVTLRDHVLRQQEGYVLTVDTYNSTDFSKDGEVLVLQNNTKGNGIKLVLMGDAFVDTDMTTGGKYESMMKKAMENYFSIEPFKSLREYYEVFCVKAVSKNNWIGKETAFQTEYDKGGSTTITGNNEKCMEYVQKALGVSRLDDVQAVIVLNDHHYAGTCYMYLNGFSIAYCPYVYNSDQSFGEIIHHEANGHGFGFLGDEYAYGGSIPKEEKDRIQELCINNGWYDNVDFTSDNSQIKWNHLINDRRYANEEVGVYEGGLTYSYGVYRATETSIMMYNVGQFNVPSREAIYKRAMRIAYGNSWKYNYEDFVAFDSPSRATTRSSMYYHIPTGFTPTAPPVIYDFPAVVK